MNKENFAFNEQKKAKNVEDSAWTKLKKGKEKSTTTDGIFVIVFTTI